MLPLFLHQKIGNSSSRVLKINYYNIKKNVFLKSGKLIHGVSELQSLNKQAAALLPWLRQVVLLVMRDRNTNKSEEKFYGTVANMV